MAEHLKITGHSVEESGAKKNLRFGLAFMGFIPVPVVLFAWLAVELQRYMNTIGSFILLASMMAVSWAIFTGLDKIRSLPILATITVGQYVALYFFFYQKL